MHRFSFFPYKVILLKTLKLAMVSDRVQLKVEQFGFGFKTLFETKNMITIILRDMI